MLRISNFLLLTLIFACKSTTSNHEETSNLEGYRIGFSEETPTLPGVFNTKKANHYYEYLRKKPGRALPSEYVSEWIKDENRATGNSITESTEPQTASKTDSKNLNGADLAQIGSCFGIDPAFFLGLMGGISSFQPETEELFSRRKIYGYGGINTLGIQEAADQLGYNKRNSSRQTQEIYRKLFVECSLSKVEAEQHLQEIDTWSNPEGFSSGASSRLSAENRNLLVDKLKSSPNFNALYTAINIKVLINLGLLHHKIKSSAQDLYEFVLRRYLTTSTPLATDREIRFFRKQEETIMTATKLLKSN